GRACRQRNGDGRCRHRDRARSRRRRSTAVLAPRGRRQAPRTTTRGSRRMSAVLEQVEHIVFLERGSLEATVRRPDFPHTWREHGKVTQDDVAARLADATIAIVNKTPLRAETIARL